MASTGLKDMSQMTTPPGGRKEVKVQVGRDEDNAILSALNRELNRGGQAFVVYK